MESPSLAAAGVAEHTALWFLSGRPKPDATVQQVAVSVQPFTVGRLSENSLCLSNPTVSGRHAEMVLIENKLFVKDLNSTNGTFVNGTRIQRMELLRAGDLLQFGTAVFEVRPQDENRFGATVNTDVAGQALAQLEDRERKAAGAMNEKQRRPCAAGL